MLLKYIRDHSSSSLARHYAGPLFDADHKTFSSIHHTCHQATRWLAIDALANMVCGDDFSITDIATDPNLALFIQPPMTVCNKHKGIVRLIFGALMNAKIMNPDETFPLVLTDESWLVRVEAIREIILNGGKYRIALHMIWQSIGSLDRVWGRDTRKEFFDGAAWIAVGPVGDVDSAREISEACGTFGALEHSAGDNSSVQAGTSLWGRWSRGNTGNRHPVKRSVLFLHETMQDLHRGVRLILRLPQPLIVGAGPYWEIPILRDMIDPSPYARVRPEKKPPWWRLICS
jgi:type IV secretion system protein VirD4